MCQWIKEGCGKLKVLGAGFAFATIFFGSILLMAVINRTKEKPGTKYISEYEALQNDDISPFKQ